MNGLHSLEGVKKPEQQIHLLIFLYSSLSLFVMKCSNAGTSNDFIPFGKYSVDSYGLDNDDFNTEELEEAVADIQDTLGADNYEDQLPQPEVSIHIYFVHQLHVPTK